nr:hypothetical protein [Tanacetum cinerariifolium]
GDVATVRTGNTLSRLATIHTEINVTNCNYLVAITNQYVQRMVRDIVQLETAVNTISHEYLLEFTSEYGIPEMLHPKLPGPGDRIVDFPQGKGKNTPQCYTKPLDSLKNWNNHFFWVDECVFPTAVDRRTNASKDGMPANGTYSVEAVRELDTHRTPIQKQLEMLLCLFDSCPKSEKGEDWEPPRAPHEVPLLTLTATRVIEMDEPAAATDSSGVQSAIEKSPLDFSHKDGASDQGTTAPEVPPPEDVPATVAPEVGPSEVAVVADPPVAQESHKRGRDGINATAPPKSLRRDHAGLRPSGSSHGGKSLAAMQLCMASNVFVSEGAPANFSDPDPLSFADSPLHHPAIVAQSSQGVAAAGDPESENVSSPAEVGSLGSVYRPEWGITNGNLLDTPEACQDLVDHAAPLGYFSELRHMHNEDFLGQYNINLARQVARRDQRIQARESEIKNLEALLETEAGMKRAAEEKSAGLSQELEIMQTLKAAFEEYKQQHDQMVEQRCAKIDAHLDTLSIDFDEELYLHMLTAIAGRRWVIGHGLRLALMKCAESLEMRQAFADVVSAGVAKGMSEGLKHGVEHGHAQLTVESLEAYDPEAEAKFAAALQSLKDLKYPLLDQLEGLKDAPMDVGRRSGVCAHDGSSGPCPFAGGCGYVRAGGQAAAKIRCSGGSPGPKNPSPGVRNKKPGSTAGDRGRYEKGCRREECWVDALQQQVSGEETLKAAFEEYKRQQDQMVEQRCAKIDAHLDTLSIDFDEELYLHMLTAIAGRRWVIGHGLRLALMKCAESLEMRQAFTDVMSAGVAKGMSEGLKHGVEHGHAQLTVEFLEAYDPEAEAKFAAALQSLKDLKSDGVPVSVPMMVPQGLALLLVDAATQTDLEDA